MKPNKLVIANTVALWAAVAWVTCTAFVWLLPGFSGTILSWWTHGRWPVSDINITFISFISGGITLGLAAWIYGWLFGWSWEKVRVFAS